MIFKKEIQPPEKVPSETDLPRLPLASGGAATHPREGAARPAAVPLQRPLGEPGRVGAAGGGRGTRRDPRLTAAFGGGTCGSTGRPRGRRGLRAARRRGPGGGSAGRGGRGRYPCPSGHLPPPGQRGAGQRLLSRSPAKAPAAPTAVALWAAALGRRPLPSPARRSEPSAPSSGAAGQGMCVRGGAFRRRTKPRAGYAAAAAARRTMPPPPPPRLLLSASRAGARSAPLPGSLLQQQRRRRRRH